MARQWAVVSVEHCQEKLVHDHMATGLQTVLHGSSTDTVTVHTVSVVVNLPFNVE